MKQDIGRIPELLTLLLAGEITGKERQELETWLEADPRHRQLLEELQDRESFAGRYRLHLSLDMDALQAEFRRRTGLAGRRIRRNLLWSAATVALLIGIGTLLLFHPSNKAGTPEGPYADLMPGQAATTLILDNGRQVKLTPGDTARPALPDFIALDHSGRKLDYTAGDEGSPQYNTLSVPRGGEYKVTLADGTFVHLNAGSELRYPVSFSGNERRVQLKGEAWFNVSKDSRHPFLVEAGGLQVRVYGTEFTVSTLYREETRVALVRGSVGVISDGQERKMQPSQLATYHRARHCLDIETRDLTPYTAWKDGMLVFDRQPLETIMEQLSRWYDIEVFFADGKARQETFTGYMKRYNSIETILKALSATVSVRFELKGKTLTIHQGT